MCLIAFAIDADAACPLLIASNRDEFLDRPTAPLHRWALPGGEQVVAGRDLRDGGTWLGVSASGRVAMLTNVRDAQPGPGRRSRGELPTRWLQGDLEWPAMVETLDPADYGGFNLVIGDVRTRLWAWVGNRDPEYPHQAARPQLHTRRLAPGVYGLSNASLDTPWPKTVQLRQAVQDALLPAARRDDARTWLKPLSRALGSGEPVAEQDMPSTGAPRELERSLSSAFVRMPERGYGTRSSLVLRATAPVDGLAGGAASEASWSVDVHEWTHTPAVTDWSLGAARSETLRW
ncbi:MAG: NRDE family protein [Hydrogenophaga sp.]|nr:NRDE family protein [Hydrogenophaga sp.]